MSVGRLRLEDFGVVAPMLQFAAWLLRILPPEDVRLGNFSWNRAA
jgi:hypothetical protein